ncbi:hypothetical protein L1987_15134 [Smallanthus sonchifolius]|uniref:Uncharacterized protein n=1 Tax=Smallanthus sonchifolius TaxID=185202 RepID=A0ACB9J5R2_9ASTR|nr:hypothetical protein L1987_15134 [Smallanthus sonchifolius]
MWYWYVQQIKGTKFQNLNPPPPPPRFPLKHLAAIKRSGEERLQSLIKSSCFHHRPHCLLLASSSPSAVTGLYSFHTAADQILDFTCKRRRIKISNSGKWLRHFVEVFWVGEE